MVDFSKWQEYNNEKGGMMKKIMAFLLLIFLAGCAIVNVYVTFPEEKIKKAAEDILAPPDQSPSSQSKPTGLLKLRFTRNLYAEEVEVKRELKTDSPAIREARKKRNSWWAQLKEFEKAGYIGEANDFRVVIKNLPDDKEKASKVRELVEKENRERKIIIREIMRINNANPEEEEKFKEIFAQTVQKYSPSGTWIQDKNGQWKRK